MGSGQWAAGSGQWAAGSGQRVNGSEKSELGLIRDLKVKVFLILSKVLKLNLDVIVRSTYYNTEMAGKDGGLRGE